MNTVYNESIVNAAVRKEWERQHGDCMVYRPDMERISEEIMHCVRQAHDSYEEGRYTAADVRRALARERLGEEDFGALLSPAARPYLEAMAERAKRVKEAWFGNGIHIFAPLYLSNYCENYCIYCGFNCHNTIRRARLDTAAMAAEMEALAKTGIREVLLLTGESRMMSDVTYIGEACRLGRKYFRTVGLEIYPVNSDEYAYLHECGADYVTVFQETYDAVVYERLHLAGAKRVFPYRLAAQERALRGGMRGVGFAALLGLADFRKDAYAVGIHARRLQQRYPHGDIALSCPRLRPIVNNEAITPVGVGDAELLQVVCAYRLFLPSASLTVSTREKSHVRNALARICATKLSAGVSTGIGGHSGGTEQDGDEQFMISDERSVAEVCRDLTNMGLQPIMADTPYDESSL